jgi:hypothetical protein
MEGNGNRHLDNWSKQLRKMPGLTVLPDAVARLCVLPP